MIKMSDTFDEKVPELSKDKLVDATCRIRYSGRRNGHAEMTA